MSDLITSGAVVVMQDIKLEKSCRARRARRKITSEQRKRFIVPFGFSLIASWITFHIQQKSENVFHSFHSDFFFSLLFFYSIFSIVSWWIALACSYLLLLMFHRSHSHVKVRKREHFLDFFSSLVNIQKKNKWSSRMDFIFVGVAVEDTLDEWGSFLKCSGNSEKGKQREKKKQNST